MAKPSRQNEVRVLFRDNGEIVTSIFVLKSGDTLTLLHDYPDFKPQIGWTAEGRGFALEIQAVNGRQLTCVEV